MVPHPAYGFATLSNLPADGPYWWQPIPTTALPEDPLTIEHVAALGGEVDVGASIAIFGRLMVVTGWALPGTATTGPFAIFDLSEPKAPALLAAVDAGAVVRDVDFIAFPDGRLVAVFASDNGIVPVYDITDPTQPEEIAIIAPPQMTHNVAIVPGTPILYNLNTHGSERQVGTVAYPGNLPTGTTEIYDLTDPEVPVLVQEFPNGYGCHGMGFYISPAEEKFRSYCAGVDAVQIWDIADPLSPLVVSTIPWPHGQQDVPATTVIPVNLAHMAIVNRDATILIAGDETGAGMLPACDAYQETEAGALSGPLGDLYFFDISDETEPVLLSQLSPGTHFPSNPPPDQGPLPYASCTAHWGQVIPHAPLELLVQAFYGAGVLLIDFTDPSSPVIVDQWNEDTNTWDAWYYNGWVFTGDMARGSDVFRFG
jgi:hypothetical protein